MLGGANNRSTVLEGNPVGAIYRAPLIHHGSRTHLALLARNQWLLVHSDHLVSRHNVPDPLPSDVGHEHPSIGIQTPALDGEGVGVGPLQLLHLVVVDLDGPLDATEGPHRAVGVQVEVVGLATGDAPLGEVTSVGLGHQRDLVGPLPVLIGVPGAQLDEQLVGVHRPVAALAVGLDLQRLLAQDVELAHHLPRARSAVDEGVLAELVEGGRGGPVDVLSGRRRPRGRRDVGHLIEVEGEQRRASTGGEGGLLGHDLKGGQVHLGAHPPSGEVALLDLVSRGEDREHLTIGAADVALVARGTEDHVDDVSPLVDLGLVPLAREDVHAQGLVPVDAVVGLGVSSAEVVPQHDGPAQAPDVALAPASPDDREHLLEPLPALGLQHGDALVDVRGETVVWPGGDVAQRVVVGPGLVGVRRDDELGGPRVDDGSVVVGEQVVPQEDDLQQGGLAGVEVGAGQEPLVQDHLDRVWDRAGLVGEVREVRDLGDQFRR